ncbi:hypothetical protein D9758_014987 [Tetrapyrgos nigripes]|uniref:CBM1 domain-containing protein n=1 Tax=Tetrapyrgos nigripes TaxID=182062 RepID=A0A8H5CEC5_9AGAR|nr:hypothetical protein D9758_014987 [Tetrapyrgos nigripes]
MSPSQLLLIAGLGLALRVGAQSPQWGQWEEHPKPTQTTYPYLGGGIGWTGATTCVSGTVCTVVNEWYSQCIPGTAAPTTTGGSPPPSSTPSAKANYWFSFGDSYTATSFNPNSTAPSTSNPFGNPPFPGGTIDGKPNWVEFASTTYNNSFILVWNYAYGGATIDASLAPPYTPTVLSETDQVNEYLNGAAKKPSSAPWTSANSLFSAWIGINDLSWNWWQTGDRLAYNDVLLDAHFALIQKLYGTGARNFLFNNVPPFERSPYFQSLAGSDTTASVLRGVIDDFNSKLQTRVATFKANNSGVTTYFWDALSSFEQILDNPSTYGFTDVTTYGSSPGQFWGPDNQGLHPSSAGHKVLAQDVAQVLKDTVW